MSTIKRFSSEELKAMPPLPEEEKKTIKNARPIESEECPFMTKNELKEFYHVGHSYYED